ncbi:DUF1990 family protein [Corynebacterium mendelii]|uniref:DUF1990 domain-containing protein n=1 Tax=Corynebacterium mendelii TaxID=2765362 RepID=A0A939DYA1_9CORY|nr:DUF1990 family protein [Corynebacterium mendelii]MBN9643464.1 DUF1990 domain-containing protein [Corynebacterium mendelii]
MLKLFSHSEVPVDSALAVALVGPSRLRMGQAAAGEVGNYIRFNEDDFTDVGCGAASVKRTPDGGVIIRSVRGEEILDPKSAERLAERGRRIVREWPAQLTYPVQYLGASMSIAQGMKPRSVLDRTWRVFNASKTVLIDDPTFLEIGKKLLNWEVHEASGVHVEAPAGPAQLNQHIKLKYGPTISPCIVVDATVTEDQISLVYGTTAGHIENGEEAFMLTRDGSGLATARVGAFSKHAWFAARVASPVAHRIQEMITRRYLNNMIPK